MDRESRYDVFLSYRHTQPDRRWAKVFHRALETYRVPRRLARAHGLPHRLRRVFRDEEELPASARLSAEIESALRQSEHLFVLCSPRTPESEWVDKEVARFAALGRENRIVGWIIEGEARDALPPALRALEPLEATEATGSVARQHALVYAFPPGRGPGFRGAAREALLGSVARVLGYPFRQLQQADQRRRRRRGALAGVLLLALGGLMAFLAWTAVRERGRARREEEAARAALEAEADVQRRAETAVQFMIGELRGEVREAGGLALLADLVERVQTYFEQLPDRHATAEARSTRIQVTLDMGHILAGQARYDEAEETLREGMRLAEALVAEPGSPSHLRSLLSTGWSHLGHLFHRMEDHEAAIAHYGRAREVLAELQAEEPASQRWVQDLGTLYSELATVHDANGEEDEARKLFEEALAIRQRLVDENPTVQAYRIELASVHRRLGSHLLGEKEVEEGVRHLETALAFREKLLAENPYSQYARSAYSTTAMGLGRARSLSGDWAETVRHYRRACELRQKILDADPTGDHSQSSLVGARYALARALEKLGRREEACRELELAIEVARGAFEAQPESDRWRRDLALALYTLGRISAALENAARATTAFREALPLWTRFAADDPAYVDRLAWTHMLLAEQLEKTKAREEALTQFERAAELREQIRSERPDDAGVAERALKAHGGAARQLRDLDRAEEALAHDRAALAIHDRFMSLHPDDPYWLDITGKRCFWVGFDLEILGAYGEAAAAYRRSIELYRRLGEVDERYAGRGGPSRFRLRIAEIRGGSREAEDAVDHHALASSYLVGKVDRPRSADHFALAIADGEYGPLLRAAGDLLLSAAIAAQASAATEGEASRQYADRACTWLRWHLEDLRRNAFGDAAASLPAEERQRRQTHLRNLLAGLRLHDPSFQSLRGTAAFEAIFSDLAPPDPASPGEEAGGD